jgi:hypothetical protein
MILMEIAYDERNKDLDYLAEFLIERSDPLTLTEAQNLIYLIEEEKQSLWQKVKEGSTKKLDWLKSKFKKDAAAARKKYKDPSVLKQYLKTLKKNYLRNVDKVKAEMQKAGKDIFGKAGRMKASVRAAFRSAPKVANKGKVGLGIAAGAAAAAGGLAAYRASKKRKAALAKK